MPMFQIAPNKRKTHAYNLSADEWTQVFVRDGRWMKSIDFHNISSQNIYIAESESPRDNEFDTLFSEQYHGEETNVDGIWAKMVTSDATLALVVIERWYEPKFMKKLVKLLSKIGITER